MPIVQTVVLKAPEVKGVAASVCKLSIRFSSAAANEEYRRHKQALGADAKDDGNASDDNDDDLYVASRRAACQRGGGGVPWHGERPRMHR